MTNIIIDCDTGEDDALAILLALANKLPMHYIVTSFGNTTIENATNNTSRLLSLVGAYDVKVIKGSSESLKKHPLEKKRVSAGDFVGKNGLCNVELPPSKINNILKPSEKELAVFLFEIIKAEAPVSYIITGPCTNFAKVCQLAGDLISRYVKDVYIMGGALYTPGNSGPINPQTGKSYAEFNFYCDPHAIDTLLKLDLEINLITWDITSTATVSFDKINEFTSKTKMGKFTITLMKNFFKYYGLSHHRNLEFNDPLTIMAYMGFGKYRKEKIKIVKKGKKYGKSVVDAGGQQINYFCLEEKEKQALVKKILKDLGVENGK